MAKVCYICSKGPVTGHNISHSHHKTKRRWLPNLQKAKILVGEKTTKSVYVCASCLSSAKVQKAI